MALFRSIATVGGWTMGSRVLGFVRDILIASLLGAGQVLSGKDQEAEVDPAVVDLVPFGR